MQDVRLTVRVVFFLSALCVHSSLEDPGGECDLGGGEGSCLFLFNLPFCLLLLVSLCYQHPAD